MIEDKLSVAQRIRLESISQANMRLGQRLNGTADQAISDLLAQAERIEKFIRIGES